MFFIQKPHKRLAINVSRIEENRYNARKKIIGHRYNTNRQYRNTACCVFSEAKYYHPLSLPKA